MSSDLFRGPLIFLDLPPGDIDLAFARIEAVMDTILHTDCIPAPGSGSEHSYC